MTIAISSNTAWSVYNFRIGLIRALLASGEAVIVLAPEDDYSQRLRDLGCRVIDFAMDNKGSNPVRDVGLLLAYRRVYRQLRPSIVLHYTIKPVIYGALAARSLGIPYVSTITGLGTAFIRDGWLTRIVENLYRLSQRKASQVFFQNNDDLALFRERKLVPMDRVRRLPGSGVNLSRFSVQPLPDGPPCFLMIARLVRDKGVVEFVEAARHIKQHHPQARFQLLGQVGVANRTAIGRAELDVWLAEGVIEYLGETDDVRPFIEQARCVVLPSYREGVPRSLLEGAAMARPLITTDAPGCRDVVEHGNNGYLCKVKDSEDLAAKIEDFLALPLAEHQRMAEASRALVAEKFEESIVVDQYLAAIKQYRLSQLV